MMNKRLLIRADASPTMGSGHIMRCLALAEEWIRRGGEVSFATFTSQETLLKRIVSTGAELIDLNLNDNGILLKQDWMAVDGYNWTEKQLSQLHDRGHKLLVIDDNAHLPSYPCDILLNYSPYAKHIAKQYYKTCSGVALLGPHYALIRHEFRCWHGTPYSICADVLVSCGKLTEHIENALHQAGMSVLKPTGEMSFDLQRVQIVVCGGGLTAVEAAYMGTPAIYVCHADNAVNNADSLANEGCGIKIDLREYSHELLLLEIKLLSRSEKLLEMSRAGRLLIDGCGAERVVDNMMLCS